MKSLTDCVRTFFGVHGNNNDEINTKLKTHVYYYAGIPAKFKLKNPLESKNCLLI